MKCRKSIDGSVVWFGKYFDKNGICKDADGDSAIEKNYASDTDAVVNSLNQRLSVIKSELWYQINYGIPLLDKINSPAIFDSVICDIIVSHPGVSELVSFASKVENHTYYFDCTIRTIYAELLSLSNVYSI